MFGTLLSLIALSVTVHCVETGVGLLLVVAAWVEDKVVLLLLAILLAMLVLVLALGIIRVVV